MTVLLVSLFLAALWGSGEATPPPPWVATSAEWLSWLVASLPRTRCGLHHRCGCRSGFVDALHYHASNLEKVFSVDPESISSPVGIMPPHANNVTYLSSLYDSPADIPADFIAIPVRAAPICVGFNGGVNAQLQMSLPTLGLLLTGGNVSTLQRTWLTATQGLGVAAADVTVYLAQSAPLNFALLRSLAAEGIPGFEAVPATVDASVSSFPRAVLANPRVRVVPTDDDVVAAVRSSKTAIGFFSIIQAAGCPECFCASLEIEHNLGVQVLPPVLDVSMTASWIRATMQPGDGRYFLTRVPGTAVYPLLGPFIVCVNMTAACVGKSHQAVQWIREFSSSNTVSPLGLRLQQFSMLPFDAMVAQAVPLRLTESFLCARSSVVRVAGTSAAVAAVSQTYLSLTSVFVDSVINQNGTVLPADNASTVPSNDTVAVTASAVTGNEVDAVAASIAMVGVSTTGFKDDCQRAEHPTIQFVPFATYYATLLANVEGVVVNMILPKCTLLRIYTGDIQYWDHPDIVNENYLSILPHARIRVVVIDGVHGLNGVVTRGLAAFLPLCQRRFPTRIITNAIQVVESLEWRLPSAAKVANVEGLFTFFSKNKNSLIAVGSHDAIAAGFSEDTAGMLQVLLMDERETIILRPSNDVITAMLAGSTLDRNLMALNISLTGPTQWPFVGIFYWLFDGRRYGNCTEARIAMNFLRWSLLSVAAQRSLRQQGFVPIPLTMATEFSDSIDGATCDGVSLFPQATSGLSTVAAAFIGIGAVVLVSAAVLSILAVGRFIAHPTERDVANAPKASPFAILFTDVESSTALWAKVPATMGPALDVHNAVIREKIKMHGAYEVKTIGDAFMIAMDSAEGAVQLAMDIQEGLHDADWGVGGRDNAEALQEAYHHIRTEKARVEFDRSILSDRSGRMEATMLPQPERGGRIGSMDAGGHGARSAGSSVNHNIVADATTNTRGPRGLKVRIGIHYGEGEVKFDRVSKGYDYVGPAVNLAGRIEAAAHGCQTLISGAVLQKLNETCPLGSPLRDRVVMSPLGQHVFTGAADGTVSIVEVLPKRFPYYRFPPLRNVENHRPDAPNNEPDETTSDFGEHYRRDSAVMSSDSMEAPKAHLSAHRGVPPSQLLQGERFLKTFFSALNNESRRQMIEHCCGVWRVRTGRGGGGNVNEYTQLKMLAKRVVSVAWSGTGEVHHQEPAPHEEAPVRPSDLGFVAARRSTVRMTSITDQRLPHAPEGALPGISHEAMEG